MKLRTTLIALGLSLVFLGRARCLAVDTLPLPAKPMLAAGASATLRFQVPKLRSVALCVQLADADFAGATILTKVNDFRMLPYHAFGGDTRYDNVKGKPGMNPPLAKIEANYVLVPAWLKQGENVVQITNAGPGSATLRSVTVRDVSGHDLPKYENPIYFDFDVWRQGSTMRPGVAWNLDSMLLGVIPGGGTHVMNLSGPTLPIKMEAEKARVNWGFGRSTFYSIWHLVMEAKSWAEFINIDGKDDEGPADKDEAPPDPSQKKTPYAPIGSQFAYTEVVPKGTDVALIKPGGYLGALKPAIDDLLPYSSDYNITCEQGGASTQGFGRRGTRYAAQGWDAKRWANNYQTEFQRLTQYIHQRNPAAPVFAPHWWTGQVRVLLYDTAKARGFKMGDMIDAFMTHYHSFPFVDYGPDGNFFIENEKKDPTLRAHPELQYPGGKFEISNWDKSQVYNSEWLLIPEIAIDWNRYRLSRTEKDMKLADPKTHRWANGKPFNFDAGFYGDERTYNNETCVYDRNYAGPSPYQFLYSMFSYSLLPTAAAEPTEFKVARTMPLYPRDPNGEDIFTEMERPINRYGDWVSGAAGTHRLKTRDPLYGDLFGYTGFEQGTTGDYIWLSGIKERHHRREPYNAWNLVRRMCYAFVTSAPVYPAIVNSDDTQKLFTKVLLVKQDGRDVIGIYAVNFHDQPHKLELTLPVGWTQPAVVQAFNEKAADWSDAKRAQLVPRDGKLQVSVTMPARSPRCLFIYPPLGEVSYALVKLGVPQPLSPWGNGNIATEAPELKWRASQGPGGQAAASYEVQLAREMLFRPADIVATQTVNTTSCTIAAAVPPNLRYHWRVRALDADGNSTVWSQPQSFWFKAGAGSAAATVAGDAPAETAVVPQAEGSLELPPFTDADNLAHRGMPFGAPNFWEGPGEAVDGNAASEWLPDDDEERKPKFPSWWAVRFDGDETVRQVGLLWTEGKVAKDFDVQTWNGKSWQTVKPVRGNTAKRLTLDLDSPVTTRAVRLWITAPAATTFGLAEVYLH